MPFEILVIAIVAGFISGVLATVVFTYFLDK